MQLFILIIIRWHSTYARKRSAQDTIIRSAFWSTLLFSALLLTLSPSVYANTLPDYLQGGGDATRTLGNFINGTLRFVTALLWGVWTIFAALFAKDLMIGTDADLLKSKAIKLGAAALVLLTITALPSMFAGFAN